MYLIRLRLGYILILFYLKMREAGKSYLWCTEAWFRTKPGTAPRSALHAVTGIFLFVAL